MRNMINIPARPQGDPSQYTDDQIIKELIRCGEKDSRGQLGFLYWLKNYCRIYNNDERGYVPFEPWQNMQALQNGYDDQVSAAIKMQEERRIICLKARQIGQTTLVLAYFLWSGLFFPTAFILLLSRGDLEAKELLLRIKKIYSRLPYWMKSKEVLTSSKTEWRLSNGTAVLSLSSRRGDSYSATHCLIDEAALLYRANTSLKQVLLNLEPTIGQKGQLFLISKIDKNKPRGTFNSMYKAALADESEYTPIFIPYYIVPGRNKEWHEKQAAVSRSIDGTLDNLYESYPETPEQALLPKSSNKRLAFKWLIQCYQKSPRIILHGGPEIPDFVVYKEPEKEGRYIIAADPSEGLATSDPASLTVMDILTKEEVAIFAAPAEPSVLGSHINKIGAWYNNAKVIFELNQHGRALELWLKEHSQLHLLRGVAKTELSRKVGWEQNAWTKTLMYDMCAKALKDGECIINDPITYEELASIESATKQAPKGQHDDRATTFALAVAAIELCIDYKFDVSLLRL